MENKIRNLAFELKSLSADGSFSGYASVFNVEDYGGDIIAPGAFAASIAASKAAGKTIPCLWQHDWTCPLGGYSVLQEDAKGLYVEGDLLIGQVAKATEAYALLQAKVITGLSIGYSVTKSQTDDETGIRTILACDLWEVSLVTFPMNDDARINSVKRMINEGHIPSLSEFEGAMREMGFTRKQATAVASHGLKRLMKSESSEEQSDSVMTAADVFSSFKKGFQS